MKRLSIMMLSAGLAGPAMAGLVIDGGQTPMFLPNNNDFKADLNGIGLDSVYDGGSDILATQTGVVEFYFHGAESANDNQFVVDGTILGNDLTPGTVLTDSAHSGVYSFRYAKISFAGVLDHSATNVLS